jgi:excisionase family DNA binding protein
VSPRDSRVLAVAAAIVGLFDALATERIGNASDGLVAVADAGIERRALRRLIREGRLRATRIGRRVYVSRADLTDLLSAAPTVVPAAFTAADPREAARASYRAPLRAVRRSSQ